MEQAMKPETFQRLYDGIERSNAAWNAIPVKGGELFEWDEDSTYIQEPPFFVDMRRRRARSRRSAAPACWSRSATR
jgi:aconitate hydratase